MTLRDALILKILIDFRHKLQRSTHIAFHFRRGTSGSRRRCYLAASQKRGQLDDCRLVPVQSPTMSPG
ncbi:hypothetical protein DPMN_027214 [Dreissena polymorpha]|uniref:Uncharacterized protein n=1 Tax=Dreissena polymorpha TaxID=45954 RepID=A0A9D4LUW2_DREPO|nr:hypothetical protein DPMN_027214 [Dreissena polymorpha]